MTPDQCRRGASRASPLPETLSSVFSKPSAQIVSGHTRNNADFRVEMVKKRLARHEET